MYFLHEDVGVCQQIYLPGHLLFCKVGKDGVLVFFLRVVSNQIGTPYLLHC